MVAKASYWCGRLCWSLGKGARINAVGLKPFVDGNGMINASMSFGVKAFYWKFILKMNCILP